jgi:hypothetical protein
MRKLLSSLLVLPFAALAADPAVETIESTTNPHIRGFAAILRDAIWPEKKVYVCWEKLDARYSRERDMVREAVLRTWQANSGLEFVGWQQCAPINKGIRIAVSDSGPHTKGLGRHLDGKVGGMVLNFDFGNWSQSCQQDREFCIKSIGIHEFGHAIGFAHEQNRHDSPGECRELRQGTDGDLLLTPYDVNSVMNYCNPKYNNAGELSASDILAVQVLYGPPVR